jgi:hypothetical protein
MTHALVACPGSKVSDDTPIDDDLDLLNFTAVASWTTCWMSSLLQIYYSHLGKSNCLVWHFRWFDFHAP